MEIGQRGVKINCIWQLEDFDKFLFWWVFRLITLAGIQKKKKIWKATIYFENRLRAQSDICLENSCSDKEKLLLLNCGT